MAGVFRFTHLFVQAWRRGLWPALAALAVFTWLFMPEPVDPRRCSQPAGDCWSAGFVTTSDSEVAFAGALLPGLVAASLVLIAVGIGSLVIGEGTPADAE